MTDRLAALGGGSDAGGDAGGLRRGRRQDKRAPRRTPHPTAASPHSRTPTARHTGSAKDDLNGGHNESGRADEDGQMNGTVETRRYDRRWQRRSVS